MRGCVAKALGSAQARILAICVRVLYEVYEVLGGAACGWWVVVELRDRLKA